MLKIQEHIKRFGLEKTIEKFRLKCKDLGHKYILKYDQLDSPFSFEEVCESRGLVLAKENFAVLSYPFYKFFTYTETKAAKIDWESATATEKRDGSLIQVYFDFIINKWCINTMFSECEELLRNSEKSLKHLFYEMMDEYKSSFDLFDINNIYVFELTSPLNKVVVNYDKTDFRLLMVRNRITLKEYSLEDKIQISKKIKLPFVEIYPFKSLDELTNSFSGKGFNFEGYVVCDKFFNRIKVKNPAYIVVHLTKQQNTDTLNLKENHRFLDVVKYNEISEFVTTFPESSAILTDLQLKYNRTLENLYKVKAEIIPPKNITAEEKKLFAQRLFASLKKYNVNPSFSSIFFNDNDIRESLINYDNKKLIKII